MRNYLSERDTHGHARIMSILLREYLALVATRVFSEILRARPRDLLMDTREA